MLLTLKVNATTYLCSVAAGRQVFELIILAVGSSVYVVTNKGFSKEKEALFLLETCCKLLIASTNGRAPK